MPDRTTATSVMALPCHTVNTNPDSQIAQKAKLARRRAGGREGPPALCLAAPLESMGHVIFGCCLLSRKQSLQTHQKTAHHPHSRREALLPHCDGEIARTD